MISFTEINLIHFLNQLGEEKAKEILLDFKSPLNLDVEGFLHNKAIEFSKQGISSTHLVFTSYKKVPVLIGYYTIANKYVTISTKKLSRTMMKSVKKYGTYDQVTKQIYIPMQLIAQLGKNYNNHYNKLISGAELLNRACDKVKKVHNEIGGKYVYLECEDKAKLIDFYCSNGFKIFGSRNLDRDEIDSLDGQYLIQLLKKL